MFGVWLHVGAGTPVASTTPRLEPPTMLQRVAGLCLSWTGAISRRPRESKHRTFEAFGDPFACQVPGCSLARLCAVQWATFESTAGGRTLSWRSFSW